MTTSTSRGFALLVTLLTSAALGASASRCPFGHDASGTMPVGPDRKLQETPSEGKEKSYDYSAIEADLAALLTTPQDFWPPDFGPTAPEFEQIDDTGNYVGLIVRLAWHCSGSYRTSDGRGGCNGARILFTPEFSWEDNTNLNFALRLLQPIKDKYDDLISWGDLIILAGNVALETQGTPVLGFCAGRVDAEDGDASLALGPTPLQEEIAPCENDGQCVSPIGPTTVGLIYVNPAGPLGVPDTLGSAQDVRNAFRRMNMNDTESVALTGGGHSFGKVHGACPTGPGEGPTLSFGDEPVDNIYNGTCGEGPLQGQGRNTFTSGFEGRWTVQPTNWTNLYFQTLFDIDWQLTESPAGRPQWIPPNNEPQIMALTSDLAFRDDPDYRPIAESFRDSLPELGRQFAAAWYKLTTGDMGPVSRCRGPKVPPAQPFQEPLPDPTEEQLTVDYDAVAQALEAQLTPSSNGSFDMVNGEPYAGALFITLAFNCANTFRATDYRGGCNGGRIRFPPQSEFPSNAGLAEVVELLEPVKEEFPDASYADLIVLAGNVALNQAKNVTLPFCPGRTDAENGETQVDLDRRTYNTTPVVAVLDQMNIRGLMPEDVVALAGLPRSEVHRANIGLTGEGFMDDVSEVTTELFEVLVEYRDDFEMVPPSDDNDDEMFDILDQEFVAQTPDGPIYITASDFALLDPPFFSFVQRFAGSDLVFKRALAVAWTKLMNADRFDGPTGSVCRSGAIQESDLLGEVTQDVVLGEFE